MAPPPYARPWPSKPDVLFFDVRMPGMSGLDAATELADQWPWHAGLAPFRCWYSSPRLTNTPYAPLKPRRWTTCSKPVQPPSACKDR